MIEREATIVNQEGLHARPAARIVRLASSFNSDIEICKDGVGVNGKSIMGVMMLSAECGSSITIRAVSKAAAAIIEEVRRQFREHPGIMAGTERPDYARAVDAYDRATNFNPLLISR